MSGVDVKQVGDYVGRGLITSRQHPTENLWILNYTPRVQYEHLWDDLTLQCRGLIVDIDGNIVQRPFRKFFNLEELNGSIPNEPFEVYEKLDGSLGILYFVDGEPFIATRGSFDSEQAHKATEILRGRYSSALFDPALTYLFEVIYPSNRIVVDYGDREDVVFLAAIRTEDGVEIHPDNIDLPVPRAKRYDGIRDLAEIRKYENDREEGFVIRFRSGMRAKAKFSEYKRLHKILTQCSNKSIWESLKDGKPLDEILEHVPDEFYEWVRRTKSDLTDQYLAIEETALRAFRDYGDRKENALYYQTTGVHPSILFSMLDKKPYDQIIWKMIRPKFSKPFRVDEE